MRVVTLVGTIFLCSVASETALDIKNSLQSVSKSVNQFSADFIKSAAKINPDNLISSPLNINVILSMLSYGAAGQTLKILKTGLHMPDTDEVVMYGYKSLVDKLNNRKNIELRVANKLFTANQFDVNPHFLQTVFSVFHSSVEKVNFVKSTEVAENINNWVENNTNNRIKNLVNADDFDETTLIVLVNAIYFKGLWAKKFNPELTSNRNFDVDINTVKQVPMMFINDTFVTGPVKNLNARFIELPYEGGEFSLIIILPNSIDEFANIQKNFHNVNITDMLTTNSKLVVELQMPKFKIESQIDLEPVLKDMGMSIIFEDKANFTNLSHLLSKVSKAIHKAYIEVNEEGSKAVAATEITVNERTYYDREFHITRPFFIILIQNLQDDKSKPIETIILFNGYIKNPTSRMKT